MIQWMLGTLLATSALIVLVLLVREPVRCRFGSRIAYGLWLIPAARIIMPTLTERVEQPAALGEPVQTGFGTPELSQFVQIGGGEKVLLALWAVGALALFIVRIVQFRRQRWAILSSATEIDHRGSIRVVRSPAVEGPVAFGILDRVIAVPIDFDVRYSEHERRLALDHEFAHHHSGDLIANAFALVLLCLHWFNPLAWAAHNAFRFDQEAACDARVLDKGGDRFDYGRAIARSVSGRSPLFATALDRPSSLHRRLKCLLYNPTAGQRLAGRLLILMTGALALPLTASHAINYVEVTSAQSAPAAAGQSVWPGRPIAATVEPPVELRVRKADPGLDGGFAPVLARIEPAIGPKTNETPEAVADQGRLKRNAERAHRAEEQVKTNAERAWRAEDVRKTNGERALRAEEQLKWNAERAHRAEEQLKRNAEGAQQAERLDK